MNLYVPQVGTHVYVVSILNMAKSPKILNSHPYLRQTLDLVSDKWVTAIIYVLSHGPKPYGELQREIGDVRNEC
jgi:DNA-binding HxlR family transcriptional regulator